MNVVLQKILKIFGNFSFPPLLIKQEVEAYVYKFFKSSVNTLG